jgi:hypothetical protein
VLAWLTHGAQIGLAIGIVVVLGRGRAAARAADDVRGAPPSWRRPCSSTSRRPIPTSRRRSRSGSRGTS